MRVPLGALAVAVLFALGAVGGVGRAAGHGLRLSDMRCTPLPSSGARLELTACAN